jgi:hypothetical protein
MYSTYKEKSVIWNKHVYRTNRNLEQAGIWNKQEYITRINMNQSRISNKNVKRNKRELGTNINKEQAEKKLEYRNGPNFVQTGTGTNMIRN